MLTNWDRNWGNRLHTGACTAHCLEKATYLPGGAEDTGAFVSGGKIGAIELTLKLSL